MYVLPIVRVWLLGWLLLSLNSQAIEEGECSFEAVFDLVYEEIYIDFALLFDIVLLSPSIKFTAFAYTPIWLVTHLIHINMRYDLSDSTQVSLKVSFTALSLFLIFTIYWLI